MILINNYEILLPRINFYYCLTHELANNLMVLWTVSYVAIRFHPCFNIILTFYVFTNKDTSICFINHKILLEAAQLQNRCISLSICVFYTCISHRNQGWACDVHHSSVAFLLAIKCTPKLHAMVHVHTDFLKFYSW